MKISREIRQARRTRMAQDASKYGIPWTAQSHGVTQETVRKSCHENGIEWLKRGRTPPVPHKPQRYLQVLTDLLNTDWSLSEIARKHGISRQRVHQIKDEATANGLLDCR